MSLYQCKGKVKIEWSPNFAYAIGLIATDGYLNSDQRHIGFVSKDRELVETFRFALGVQNLIGKRARGGETEKKYSFITIGDKMFCRFLNTIGLFPKKSKTIQSVNVPERYFADFLRGAFDGDGTFYSFWDKRWPNSFGYQLAFSSASHEFTYWMKNKLTTLYGVKGAIHKGDGVLNLRYVKGGSRKLISAMYYHDRLLHLSRKYIKIQTILGKDEEVKKKRKRRGSSVVEQTPEERRVDSSILSPGTMAG